MVSIIREICTERNISFSSLSDDWIIELTKDSVTKRIIGYSFSLNDAVAASIAKDKVATYLLLNKAKIPSVPHVLLRPKVTEAQKKPMDQWEKIVVKPLEGTSGYGVKLLDKADAAVDWVESSGIPAWAASPFVPIKREIRFILLDQKTLIVFEKEAVVIEGLKMFNLGLGATPKDVTPDQQMLMIVAHAQAALGLRLGAVDIIETEAGEYKVLEVNSGFMMEHYMRHSEDNFKKGYSAYERIIDEIMPV